jgi:NADH:ubiquinone oxidoreductase subunit E
VSMVALKAVEMAVASTAAWIPESAAAVSMVASTKAGAALVEVCWAVCRHQRGSTQIAPNRNLVPR